MGKPTGAGKPRAPISHRVGCGSCRCRRRRGAAWDSNWRAGGHLLSLAGIAAAGSVVGTAAFYRIVILPTRHSAEVVLVRSVIAAADEIASPGEPLLPTAVGRLDALHAKASVVTGELGHYQKLLGILRDQIANVSVETEGAALDILTRLNEIDRHIRDMISFLSQTDISDRMADLMDRTEAQMAKNRHLLEEFRESCNHAGIESQERLSEVQDMVAGLNRIVGQVRDISRQTNMLAINAAIEATRAGEVGKGFAVVASEVKQLSRDSDKAAVDIQGGISRLQDAISDTLQTMVRKRLEAEGKALDVISGSISGLTENLDRLLTHQRGVLMKVQEASEMIAHPILALIGSIQFQDVTRQELQHVSQAMELVAHHSEQLSAFLQGHCNDHEPESIQSAITELMADYVMSQQRNIHNASISGGEVEDKGLLIELF
jgi:methyl-accepting chemotaxis protein